MIGRLQGVVDYVGAGFVILTAGGVGYKVWLPSNVLFENPVGSPASFWIETIVREDAITLIGFGDLAAQDMFIKLTSVSGVGPKSALAILGAFKLEVLSGAIAGEDVKTLTAAPGVGKKVAERIIVELKGKVGIVSAGSDAANDTLSALETLGYRRADVVELVQKLAKENPGDPVQSLITKALKGMNNG
jgi:Holliday junction DNA helicase RuvA